MMFKHFLLISATAVPCVGHSVGAAQAALIYSSTSPTGITALPNSYSYTFASPASSGILSFQLQGYGTLDGVGYWQDTFSLFQGKTAIYEASFNLGGGGFDVVFQAPSGSTYALSPDLGPFETGRGVTADIKLPVSLGALNTLTFAYTSVGGPFHAGYQGITDEGFGINSVQVSTVPLPGSLTLFGSGLAMLGLGLKRMRRAA